MWYILFTLILFYFLTIFQTSFFAHFDILGVVPNLIFIAFVSLVFLDSQKKDNYYNTIIWAFIAGILLDILAYPYFGASIAILVAVGFTIKSIQTSLKEQKDEYPLTHFLIVFLSSFILFRLSNIIFFHFENSSSTGFSLSWAILIELLYNTVIAVGGFYFARKVKYLLNVRKKLQS